MKDLEVLLDQIALKHLGLYQGKLDGLIGNLTRAAKAKFLESQAPSLSAWEQTNLNRWNQALASTKQTPGVKTIVNRIIKDRARYEAVAAITKVPWYVIAGIHNMEASGSFSRHLHEGSPLTARTKFVPKGRPLKGSPPFTWEESAIDALEYDKMHTVNWASLAKSLQAVELYNGAGYQKYHPETPSPYLWAGTSVEKPGKYVADGKWSATAISSQIGVAAIWKELQAQGFITLPS